MAIVFYAAPMSTCGPDVTRTMAIKTLHLTNSFHAHSGGISTFYMALLGGIRSFASESNAWLAEPDAAAFAAAVGQATHDKATRSAKVRAGLATAAEHSWASAARGYFALYDAIHAQFWGLDSPALCPPCAWSTPASSISSAVITASSTLAQTFCRVGMRLGGQTMGGEREKLSRRYTPLVPSVTGKEEKQRTFCIQEGQT